MTDHSTLVGAAAAPAATAPAPGDPVLEIRDLQAEFRGRHGTVKAVNGVSYSVAAGETLAVVGESGCGKSATAMSALRVLPDRIGRVTGGQVVFCGEDLLEKSEKEMTQIRGRDIGMIFQEPMTSLNPVLTIGRQLTETMEIHLGIDRKEAERRAVDLLKKVRIADAERRLGEYPHQLSGGMRQRVMLAMATACEPKLLIADEPTTALDVTVQAQILDMLKSLSVERGIATILITHNLGLVARYADRVVVMYAGRVVESGTTLEIFQRPRHPYTKALLRSMPRLDQEQEKLEGIGGQPPNLSELPTGCPFRPRCPMAVEQCAVEMPPLEESGGHSAACWRSDEVSP